MRRKAEINKRFFFNMKINKLHAMRGGGSVRLCGIENL